MAADVTVTFTEDEARALLANDDPDQDIRTVHPAIAKLRTALKGGPCPPLT